MVCALTLIISFEGGREIPVSILILDLPAHYHPVFLLSRSDLTGKPPASIGADTGDAGRQGPVGGLGKMEVIAIWFVVVPELWAVVALTLCSWTSRGPVPALLLAGRDCI